MLAKSRSTACATADSETAILLETTLHRVCGIEQLQGHGTFPVVSVAVGIRIDAGGRVEEIGHLGHYGHRGNLCECLLPLRGRVIVHHVRVHAVINRVAAPGGWEILRWHTGRWPVFGLVDHIRGKYVRGSIDVCGFPIVFESACADYRGVGD